ncbi:glycosyltransferase family 4 protein [Nocardioides sp.]|uniref:glycosyltransferase family 4 protein n=1 Tax=Nocardioides sp. TaxID=35761 RepID=UPI003528C953
MRIAIVAESFLPQVNGVSNTVRHVVERATASGHDVLVVAPGPGPDHHAGAPVVRTRSLRLPGYRSFPMGLPDVAVHRSLERFAPDVVHLASPVALGAVGLRSARQLGVPTVGVYQTDVAGFARHYGLAPAEAAVDRWVAALHQRMQRTLAPSSASQRRLEGLGVDEVHLWRRGVSLDLFGPERRREALRRSWGADGRTVVGYVGRLAAEKQVRRLVELADLPGVHLVVVGDGPERDGLEAALPRATFTGMLRGAELAAAFASLDVFVHTGEHETFCQTVQEAQASGVAVVVPAAGGPLDLVSHGRSGLFHTPDERTSFATTVAAVARDPLLRRRLALGGRRAVAARTWERVVDELLDEHYPAVTGQRVARPAA